MALAFMHSLQNIWPLSILKYDDLKASNGLVSKLSIPENTKRFVYAVRDSASQSVIYILCVQNLSERSAMDAERLIRAIRPEAVVAQVSNSAMDEILSEDIELGSDGVDNPVPTSFFGVIKKCFVEKINKDKYENVACNLVLKEIFGIGFYGHIVAAKKVAKDVGSSFLLVETPVVQKSAADNDSSSEVDSGSKVPGLARSLLPNNVSSLVSSSSRRFCVTDDVQLRMVKLLSSYVDASLQKLGPSYSILEAGSKEVLTGGAYHVPSFAQSIYPLLLDLHNIFVDIPSITRALASSQKMFYDVNKGEYVDTEVVSEVYTFRIAVEGLRIALNSAGRLPIRSLGKFKPTKVEFSELPIEDKSCALLAQALQSQTTKFKTVVALVDSSSLAGLRKHWDTSVPPEIKEMVGQLITDCELDEEFSNQTDEKQLFSSKPVMAFGAGATAVLGASSLSKVVNTSTFLKVLTFKLPAPVNVVLTQTQKSLAVVLGKTLVPSKIAAPGFATGANATSVLKSAASAEKIRAVAHSVIASVEKTSISAMRTAFYEIMRKRQVRPIGFLPWATFGCSIATCSGLLMYGDGIECAVESVPVAPSIASLGRGIENLHKASQSVGQSDKIYKAIESLMYRLKKVKPQ